MLLPEYALEPKMNRLLAAAALLFALTPPALAADYYVAAHFVSANGDGDSELLVNGGSLHGSEEGYKVADIASVNAGGTATTVYTAQFDCAAKSWRVTNQNDYYIANQMAPVSHATRDLPAFTPVSDGTPVQGAMTMICGWPATIAGLAKVTAADPVALSKAVSPTLKFVPPGGGR